MQLVDSFDSDLANFVVIFLTCPAAIGSGAEVVRSNVFVNQRLITKVNF